MIATLLGIAAMLGVSDLFETINKVDFNLDTAEKYATKLLNIAKTKGSKMLSEAERRLSAVPDLAGSPIVMKALREARREARDNLQNVETKVNKMEDLATEAGSELRRLGNRTILEKAVNDTQTDAKRTINDFEKKIGEIN